MQAVRAAGRVVLAPTMQSRTICHVRGGECAVNVHAVAVSRVSSFVTSCQTTCQHATCQTSPKLRSPIRRPANSNLGNLSRPWMLHLAAEIDNRSPRRRLHHRNHIQISEWGTGALHPFPICPRSASRANPAKVSRDMAVLPRTQPRSTYISQLKVV